MCPVSSLGYHKEETGCPIRRHIRWARLGVVWVLSLLFTDDVSVVVSLECGPKCIRAVFLISFTAGTSASALQIQVHGYLPEKRNRENCRRSTVLCYSLKQSENQDQGDLGSSFDIVV